MMIASATLVHFSGGYIEFHFHFFVALIVVSLYEDWATFLAALGFVVIHHGVVGVWQPENVYNHADAIAHPWRWAGIHGAFVLAASIASVINWRIAEHTRARSELVLQSVGDGILGVDATGRVTFANRAAEWGLQMRESAMLGRSIHDVVHSHAGHTEAQCELLTQVAITGRADTGEDTFAQASGTSFPVEYSAFPMGAHGGGHGAVVSFRDTTERKRFEERLSSQALHDHLTGLPNRRLFSDRLQHALGRSLKRGDTLAVAFIDLDRFKVVNDSLGHGAGDALLITIGRRLMASARPGDTVARLGGDEFAVLIEGVSGLDEAVAIAEEMLTAIRQPVVVSGRETVTTASLGLTFSSPLLPYDRPDDALRDADIAMYQAKQAGGGVAVFDAAMRLTARADLELENDLRLAVSRNELVLHYQPEVTLSEGALIGMEALVRWKHPKHGLLAPGRFIPIAEQSDLIVEIGEWVLREACRQLGVWHRQFPMFRGVMGVNLSSKQLVTPGIADLVSTVLETNGLEPYHLCLEVTETEMMQDEGAAVETLDQLRAMGVGIAIDDFGTGYSSLSYLQRLPAQVVKLDRSFVAPLATDGPTRSIVRAIVALADALQLDTVAEGIETASQLQALRALGCRRGQGFLFAQPVPAAEMTAIIAEGGVEVAPALRLAS
ncbi:MAG TPA: EAL domain-containing protein, partial [Tepidiformaceae bacterium]|nr:EAL domain-containing protein [Tepidiformaceae bacterium]